MQEFHCLDKTFVEPVRERNNPSSFNAQDVSGPL
jgi:hypothetical protein